MGQMPYVRALCGAEPGAVAKSVGSSQQRLLGFWTREFPFERQLLACYQTLTETATKNEGQKVTLKPEIPIVSWMMSETHSNWMVAPRRVP